MKKIILFFPTLGDFDTMRTKPGLPLGVLHAASIVSKYYEVKIIDERVSSHWVKELEDYICDDVICAGVSALTGYQIKGGLEFSKFIKRHSNIPVVWGGIHATILPAETVKNEDIDYVVEGEGDIVFYELVRALEEKNSVENVAGIWYKKSGKPVRTGTREFADMNKLPDLPYHLIDMNDYLQKYTDRTSINFESSRGCPFKCAYCYNTVVNKSRWRCLAPEETVKRIEKLITKYPQIQSIYFIDDNFFIDKKRACKIMKGLKELGIPWFSQGVDIITLKSMDEAYYKLIENSNCLKLTVGIESGSPRIRKLLNKRGTPEEIISVAREFKKYNLIFYCDFMVGIPTETKNDIKASINLLFKLQKINKNFRNSAFYVYVPYPGTPLYEKVKSTESQIPRNLEEWSSYGWHGLNPGRKKKMYGYMHVISLFIDKKAQDYNAPYFLRVLVSLYRPVAKYRMKLLFFRFPVEIWFYRVIQRVWYEIRKLKKSL